ncbi:MAG: CvpA family protein [Clostridia bacterium]|nr:CvpA family protein [Clostridia bacterium]
MYIILDLIVVGIIALFTFLGYKQGLVKSAIKILSFFIAIIVSLILYKPVSNVVINNTSIDENIKNVIIEKIKPDGVEQNEEVSIQNSITNKMIGAANNTIEEIANVFSVKLIEICVLLLLYIIIKIVLKFVSALTDLITKLPVLKQINKFRAEQYMV